jgi:hypothetical protein
MPGTNFFPEAAKNIQVALTDDKEMPVLSKATIVLTPTQVKALFSTPITLVPAYGAGTFIEVQNISAKLTYGSAQYAGANNLEFRYTDGSGVKVTSDITAAWLNSAATAYYSAPSAAGVAAANAPVVVAVPTANPTTGDSPVTLEVWFTVHKL